MGLYNFQKMFVPYVKDGSKQHTIRAVRSHADKPGNMAHLYSGLRTKRAELIFRCPVVRVEEIEIRRAQLWVDGEELSLPEKNLLAYRDGFRSVFHHGRIVPIQQDNAFDAMLSFWAKKHGDVHFRGHVIHWDFSRRLLA